MPQLSQLALVYQSQWFWLLLVLAVIYFFVGRGIVGKVEETVDDRDATIAKDLAEAQRLQDEAEKAEEGWRETMNAAHSEAQATTANAKASAAQESEARVNEASEAIAGRIATAEAGIARSRNAAIAEMEGVAAEAAQDLVAKLAGMRIDDAAARGAVAGMIANA